MSEARVSLSSCSTSCSGQGEKVAAPPMNLAEIQGRFRQEATQGTCDTGRYRMPYFSWGSGPPLVFVHGVSDISQSFLLPMSRLCEQFRCIGYDLPAGKGDGASLRRYSHDDLIEDLWALLDHLRIEKSYLLGCSFGSTIVLKAMHAQPDRIPRGILQGGLARRPLRPMERWLARLGLLLSGPTRGIPYREKIAWQVSHRDFLGRHGIASKEEIPSHPVYRYLLECTGTPPIRAFSRQVLWLDRVDLRPILPSIKQPVLLFCGELDRVSGRRHEEMLLAGLSAAKRVMVPGCGHVPSYSHPEILAEVTSRFLTPGAWTDSPPCSSDPTRVCDSGPGVGCGAHAHPE